MISAKCSRDGSVTTEVVTFRSPKFVYIEKKCFSRSDFYLLFYNYFFSEQQEKGCVVQQAEKHYLILNFLYYFLLLALHAASVGAGSSLNDQGPLPYC